MTRILEFSLYSKLLCLGERIKKGTFRPTITTIPYTQITGALRTKFKDDLDWTREGIHAIGYFTFKENGKIQSVSQETGEEFREKHVSFLEFSPRDRGLNTSKLPLTTEYLCDVTGKVFALDDEKLRQRKNFEITMGALKSKGFGRCELEYKKEHEINRTTEGSLLTRLPERQLDLFSIDPTPYKKYGYLFRPTSKTSGEYVRSLFEGSIVTAPDFLVKEDE
jgi:hypothetical protein